jgi:hypothetical protein
MGVLYEHWRPDLNECFYVGISWANEETRPWDMNDRSSRHISVQEELCRNGLATEVRIQAENLDKDELCELEKLQILYWKNLIGDRLKNTHPGGIWTNGYNNEEREQIGQALIDFYKTTEGLIVKNKLSIFQKKYRSEFLNSLEGQIWRQSESDRMIAFYETPEGDAFKIKQGLRMRGEKHPCAKITTETAQAILDFEGTNKQAAQTYNVSYKVAREIRNGIKWRHLTPSSLTRAR